MRTLVAAAVLFNPAVLALSAVWGQVDAVPAMFVLWSLLLLFASPPRLRYEIAAFLLFAVAISIKPQSAFVLPVMLYALYRRHLYRRSLSEVIDGALRIGLIGAVSLGVWLVSGLPFGLGPVSLVRFNGDAANNHAFTSANAFNLWGVVGFWRNDSVGDHVVSFAGISAFHIGLLLFAVATGVVLWQRPRGDRTRRAGGNRAHDRRGKRRAPRVRAPDADARALHVPRARRSSPRSIFLRPLRIVYAALSALFLLNLWYAVRVLQHGLVARPGLPLQPVVRLALRRVRHRHVAEEGLVRSRHRDRARRRVARRPLGRDARAAASSACGAGPGDCCPRGACSQRARRRRLASPGADRHQGRPHAGGRSRSSRSRASSASSILRGETAKAVNLNDSSFHLQMVRWAGGQIREGRVPLDGWYPYLTLGSSFFHHYQSLPHTLTAYDRRASPVRATRRPTSGSSTCSSRCGRSRVYSGRAAARLGTLDRRGRGGCLTAHRQRLGLRLRARQLHVARLRRLLAALGDVAAAARLGH